MTPVIVCAPTTLADVALSAAAAFGATLAVLVAAAYALRRR